MKGLIEESKLIICEYMQILLELSSFSLREEQIREISHQLRYKKGDRAWPDVNHS